jgi:hypothetical protein
MYKHDKLYSQSIRNDVDVVSTVHRVDSLADMLIVFDSKSSLIYYTFDKIKFLSPLRICIILLSKSIFKKMVQNPAFLQFPGTKNDPTETQFS